ncbi:mandelate racemase/muconate lactonizing enzyme family protein [Spirosoma sp. KCTC 42546]|uniref:mandelate racemase/muconate lactonizing enzyme family protein n=1 Tax=Spirosoma sp. KCTC 42546 TaxID=2520506 RepID=UPI0011599FE2|nr:mandelate racemase/muconate lactonizing enzyme family protein [Spirosoma sp. KCTC 42546]QDK80358.1 mandelate racemase/muconate lactonizing enzyme family protein [Spirosoma sp. KCTC 42546]
MHRRQFLQNTLAGSSLLTNTNRLAETLTSITDLPNWKLPDLRKAIPDSVLIRSVELLKTQQQLMLVVTAQNGTRGITQCNDRMQNLSSLLKGLVIEHFVGKDARDLPELVDNAYRLNSNYKYAGMPLWNSIGSVEIAVWDLLGRIARKPVYELLGKPIRTQYGVYISDFDRGTDSAEVVVDRLAQKLAATGAKGVKIKVGGRMRNTPEDEHRTRAFVPLVRKKLGDSITIYADANGSYTPEEGIQIGRMLEDNGVAIFEEPCNFEDEDGIRRVNKALTKLVMAGGEQDTSLYRFERLARTDVYDLLQADVYYNGGILRGLQVAEIARSFGKHIAPHTPKADPLIAPFWHLAAVCPNLYGLQETVYELNSKAPTWYEPAIHVQNGTMHIPNTPGLGIDYDDKIWKSAERIG